MADNNGGTTARFVNCANVVIHDCEFVMGERPVEMINSTALITNSLIRHNGPWLVSGFPVFSNNSVGLDLDHSTATITASIVRGASHISAPIPGSWGPKTAVFLDHSVLNMGPGAFISGGNPQPQVSYITAMGASQVFLDPRGTIAIAPTFSDPPPIPKDLPATMYDKAAPGETFEYRIAGPPLGYAILVIGNYQSSALPTVFGDLSLDPLSLTVIGCHALDNLGEYLGTLAVPLGVGSPFVYGLQSLTLSPNGEFGLTSATTFVLGWQGNVSPY